MVAMQNQSVQQGGQPICGECRQSRQLSNDPGVAAITLRESVGIVQALIFNSISWRFI